MGEEPRFRMRTSFIAWGATLALLLGFAVSGEAAKYTFTKIADTSGDFSGFGTAAINDGGTVAFTVVLRPVGTAVYTSDGTTPTAVADRDGKFNGFFNLVSINNNDVVAFKAALDNGEHGIFSSDGTTYAVASRSGPFVRVFDPSMNDDGTVVFFAFGVHPVKGIFKSDGATEPTAVADINTDGPSGKFRAFREWPSINDRNTVAYRASDGFGVWGIFTDEGTTRTTIAHTSSGFSSLGSPSINNKDTVAFLATLDGGSGVFVDDGAGTTPVSDSSGPFMGFRDLSLSINDEGSVAFLATTDDGVRGIFTGPEPTTDKVIAEGDTLLGLKVKSLCDACFGREGLNNAGQLAFVVQFEDDTWGVYRADPAPSELEVIVDIKPGGNPNMINMKSKGKVPVAILGTDDFDVTDVDVATVTLAGTPVAEKKNGSIMAAVEDVDGDGDLDLVFHVETQDLVQPLTQALTLNEGATETTLELAGSTVDGTAFKGSDSVVMR